LISKRNFNNSGASKATQDAIQDYFKAFETLENEYRRSKKGCIKSFFKNLMGRKV
jgi:geranylgeranyl diphosphate synthase type II